MMSDSSENESPLSPASMLDEPEKQQNGGTRESIHYSASLPINPQYLPGGRRSLSGISFTAFNLGIAFGITSMLTIALALVKQPVWRAPFFIAALSVFHYLEFDMTARYNPPDAKVSSFLLFANGSAYNIAHAAALTEVLLRSWLASSLRPEWLRLPQHIPTLLPTIPSALPVGFGMLCILTGQYVRSAAMATAGKNFNHLVQSTKKDDHVLVSTGIYAFSRHPSYFGFFWWGLGTQIVLGNHFCFLAYSVVLWKFFATRITKEEKFLVSFFGDDYINYRKRTPVFIPFIR